MSGRVTDPEVQTTVRVLLAALLVFCVWAPNPAYSQRLRMQPPGTVHVIGPDGAVAEALWRAVLGPGEGREWQARYTAAASTAQALRSLAAAREPAPADLVLLDPVGADQGFARGLIAGLPRHALAALATQLPLARAASDLCAAIAFDALALTYLPDTIRPSPRGLDALAEAPLADRLALPLPSELLGIYLVGLLAIEATGDWRRADAGLGRLRALRGAAADPGTSLSVASRPDRPPGLALAWNSSAQLLREAAPADARQGVVIPREGTMLRPLLLCLSANSPNLRGAFAVIEAALGPEAQLVLATSLFVAPASEGVVLPASIRARVPSLEDGAAHLLEPDRPYRARLRGGISERAADRSDAAPVGLN